MPNMSGIDRIQCSHLLILINILKFDEIFRKFVSIEFDNRSETFDKNSQPIPTMNARTILISEIDFWYPNAFKISNSITLAEIIS